MKREGRQHGMVRTYRILPEDAMLHHTPRFVNQIHTQPTAGMFAKVSSKPTNHSKSTGLSNSKKTKHRNSQRDDGIFNIGANITGVSATGVLNSIYQHEDEREDLEIIGGSDGEGSNHLVIDADGGDVTTGEMVILLEQNNEEDWCFVGADA